ncbi:unnamed protein product [Peniophora sp. CBMAI 1063]|nr:unnamed protein product [Peniophora sp. CBMAI 1063]
MKFARYLDDALTPEWKRAYIDYKGLKKRITAVRREQTSARDRRSGSSDEESEQHGSSDPLTDTEALERAETTRLPPLPHSGDIVDDADDEGARSGTTVQGDAGSGSEDPVKVDNSRALDPAVVFASSTAGPSTHPRRGPGLRQRSNSQVPRFLRREPRNSQDDVPLTLEMLIAPMSPAQKAFVEKLDREHDKVESFYLAREKEARTQASRLRMELNELKQHRALFHQIHPGKPAQWAAALISEDTREALRRKWTEFTGYRLPQIMAVAHLVSPPATANHSVADLHNTPRMPPSSASASRLTRYDPDEYERARKRVKKALLEHYRAIETLNNYRILNLTGFRKALKKFEKATRIPLQTAYMREKVEPSAFAHSDYLDGLLHELEEQFSERFTRGDRKKAMLRLRSTALHKTHHFSTFRTGLFVGLAVPVMVSGIVQSFHADARGQIPGWDALLYVYGTFLIPTFFSFLIGLNMLVWARSRINFVFIFDLDPRQPLDYREYFQLPAALLALLCYAFWLSFSRAGGDTVSPHTWPLVWLLLVIVGVFNPLPIMDRSARYWFVSKTFRLVTSGVHRVEFADFWLGDQFCSLVFFLGNIYYVGCAYHIGFDEHTAATCSRPALWGVPFLIGSLPLLARLVQSIRRYVDSGLYTHLINGGKYGAGVIYYLFYYLWRHNGQRRDASFVLFVLFATLYACYACAWDFLMDWSLLKPHAKHPLLRDNILYPHSSLYYFALFYNILIRFVWVIYIPTNGPNSPLRTFIAAMLEVLRRWQWNFYRLENEHLGNVDQYRITKEIPLYYARDNLAELTDAEDDKKDSLK